MCYALIKNKYQTISKMNTVTLETLVMFANCHDDDCVIQQHDVTTQTRHVCYGIDVNMIGSHEASEELAHFSDDMTLDRRVKRLQRRTRYLKRRIQIFKDEYLVVRQLDDAFNNINLSQQTCAGLTDIGSHQFLSIHRKIQMARYLENEYDRLTKFIGVLTLMHEDEEQNEYDTPFTHSIATTMAGAESLICELFFTIRKVYSELETTGLAQPDSHVANGWYTPVVATWCPTSTKSCRRERNGIILTQLTRFAIILRNNIRAL